MRNISPASLEQLRQKLGGEPVNLIQVQWRADGPIKWYSDKFVGAFNAEGRILELSNLENVVKLSGSSRSQSITVKLDDSDGVLKDIIDNTDIHKLVVNVYQWFTNLPASEAFWIYQGEINSPIIWREGDRTLSFEVVEKIEDKEVGFSPEEGQFDFIPEAFVGKPWPIGFGTNIRVPALKINEPPVGITRHPIGFVDPTLQQKINQNALKIGNLHDAAWLNAFYAGECAFAAFMMNDTADELQKVLDGIELADKAIEKEDQKDFVQDLSSVDSTLPQSDYQTPGVATLNDPINPTGNTESDTLSLNFEKDDAFSEDYSPKTITNGVQTGWTGGAGNNITDITSGLEDKTRDILNKAQKDQDKLDIQSLKNQISSLRSQAKAMESKQKQLEQQENKHDNQKSKIGEDNKKLADILKKQRSVGQITSVIKGEEFPRGPVEVQIGSVKAVGSFAGDTFVPSSVIPNPDARVDVNARKATISSIDTHIERAKFTVINPGATVKLLSIYPIYYIVNILPSQIHEVLAKRVVNGGASVLTPLPLGYYSVEYRQFVNENDPTLSYEVTMVVLPRGLSTYDNEGWEDQLYVSFTSPIGPNTIDIMVFLIQFYTHHQINSPQFTYVKEKVAFCPSHFVLTARKNILAILEELAFQARLALWLDNGIFQVKYLPEEVEPIDTITADDIEYGTLEIGHTRTEDVVTKFVAKYKFLHEDKDPNIIVLRYNINKYNVMEQSYDFYAYNGVNQVYLSAAFWLIRKANVYKTLKFKTFLNKLHLETFDTVWIDFDSDSKYKIADTPVKGEIESCKYDSASNTVELEIRTSVRIGEMVSYPFYYPAGLSPFFYFPTNEEISDGSVGNDPNTNIQGDIPAKEQLQTNTIVNHPHDMPDRTNRPRDFGPINVSDDRQGEPFQIGQYEQGTIDVAIDPQVAQLRELTSVPGIKVGDIIDIGGNINRLVIGISNTVSDVFKRILSIIVSPPMDVPIGRGSPVLKGLSKAENMIEPLDENSYNDYQYREYITAETPVPDPPEPEDILAGKEGGGGVPVKITDGTGDTYTGDAYPDGPDGDPEEDVTVKVLQIDLAETIPPDTWLIATKIKDVYYVQPPIWMG